jgi:plasmid replication initiation protein
MSNELFLKNVVVESNQDGRSVVQNSIDDTVLDVIFDDAKVMVPTWVSMSNALVQAAHGLSLSEKRLTILAISKLDSKKTPQFNRRIISEVTAFEYAKTYDVSMNTAYDELKSATKTLFSKYIRFFEPAYKQSEDIYMDTRKVPKRLSKTATREVQIHWAEKVRYYDGEGRVDIFWVPDIIEHLMGLKRHFTSYQLQQTRALRSTYSWRLLELLMQFRQTGWAEFEISRFCDIMEATSKQKENFANIRRRIIEPAIKELEEKDGWTIEWIPIKTGRKVKAVRFKFVHRLLRVKPLKS